MEKRDLRIQKTYSALFNALQSLLEKKDFDEISVKELCDLALVRTATFYNHFSDKYEFIFFMLQETFKNYRKEPVAKDELEGPDFYIDLIHDGVDILEHNPVLIRAAFNNSMIWTISGKQRQRVRTEILNHLLSDQQKGYKLAANPEILTELIIGSLEQAARWWISEHKPYPKEKLIAELSCFMGKLIE